MPHQNDHRPLPFLDEEAVIPGLLLRRASLATHAEWLTRAASQNEGVAWKAARRTLGIWQQLPAASRWGGACLAILVTGYSVLPTTSLPAAAQTRRSSPEAAVPAVQSGFWPKVQQNILNRAAIALTDDFRTGLADWEGADDWARSWSYDAAGFVRTGSLAVYSPSKDLTDYRMEFLGQIERRSIGWTVRSSTLDTYYAIKLTNAGAGPVPDVRLVRYPVIGGVAGTVSSRRVPMDLRTDTVYRVLTEVNGNNFVVFVQGMAVDSWSETRLRQGGVGFFSGKGELARLRWVGVWHQYDTLGRLCALLAPSGLPARERGASQ